MFKLTQKLPPKYFVLSQIIIIIAGLIFAFWLYYVLYIEYQPQNKYSLNVGPVTTVPKTLRIDLDEPDDNTLTFESSILISGKTKPNTEVLISTDSDDQVIESRSDGSFSFTLDLDEGINRISVAVFDEVGEMRSIERTVYYSKEKI
ncbi:MAG: hypothetical protein Q8P92_03065 [Candidatus Daviesbacteria bacterium]|nr:hypothetical protein [Candidatus Daviesbacteria bacterium]